MYIYIYIYIYNFLIYVCVYIFIVMKEKYKYFYIYGMIFQLYIGPGGKKANFGAQLNKTTAGKVEKRASEERETREIWEKSIRCNEMGRAGERAEGEREDGGRESEGDCETLKGDSP